MGGKGTGGFWARTPGKLPSIWRASFDCKALSFRTPSDRNTIVKGCRFRISTRATLLAARSGDTTFSDAQSSSVTVVRSSGTYDANRRGQLRRIGTRRRDSNPQPLHPPPFRQSRKQSALPLSYVALRLLDRCEPCIEMATGFVDAFPCQIPKSG